MTSATRVPTPRLRRTGRWPRRAGEDGSTALARPRPLTGKPMDSKDTPLTTRAPPPGDAPRRSQILRDSGQVQGRAGGWGPGDPSP